MKKLFIGLISFTVVITVVVAAYCIYNASIYNKAVEHLQHRSFDEAGEVLKKYDELVDDLMYADSEIEQKRCLAKYPETDFFKDFPSILAYTHIGMLWDDDDNLYKIHKLLSIIPNDYSGKFSRDISDIRAENDEAYRQYTEQREKERAEQEAARKAEMHTRMPYIGMSEEYIDDTMVGKSDSYRFDRDNKGHIRSTLYSWRAYNGKDVVLVVTCKDDKVTDITKYYENVYWNSDGTPNFGATKPSYSKSYSTKSSSGYSGSKKSSSKYSGNGYDDAYDDVYSDGEPDWDRYDEDEDYANGADDAMEEYDEYGEDW